MARWCLRLVCVVLASVTLSCASLPPKQVATVDVQQVEKLLGTVQDSATALCLPNPPTHCTSSVNLFTDASWHALNVALIAAFNAQVQLATALRAWTPGTGTAPSVAAITTQVQAIVAAVQALPVGAQEAQLLAQAQAVLTEIATVSALIQQAQSSAAGS